MYRNDELVQMLREPLGDDFTEKRVFMLTAQKSSPAGWFLLAAHEFGRIDPDLFVFDALAIAEAQKRFVAVLGGRRIEALQLRVDVTRLYCLCLP